MDRHLMTSTAGTAQNAREANAEADVARANPARDRPRTGRTLPAASRSRSAAAKQRPLRSVASWTHTLALEGDLTHRTAHALEVEIERLCEQGVTAIALDLRGLASIDRVGVAVVAFRWRLCERRGYSFELIAGSQRVQREFARAGVAEMLPFRSASEDPAPAHDGNQPEVEPAGGR